MFNSGNNELQTSFKVPFDCDDVFDAIEKAMKAKYSIKSSNKLSHTILFKTPTTLTSYGEDFTINVGESFDGKAEISLLCVPRNNNFQSPNLAKARKNFNTISEEISNAVSKCPPKQNIVKNTEPTTSAASQIMEFKQLLDAGAITEEEFNQKKKQLLGL